MTTKLFSELGLSPETLRAIDKLGFEQASPIQAEAIPVLMSGRDVVGQSQTGSGKTAAFSIPAIEKTDPLQRFVQVLVLCPTRELAVQVSEEIHKLAFFKRGIHALPIYGGQSYERQFRGLQEGAQIVIGTPGRVMDHMRRGTLRLDKLKMMILDEADVMLDMGFREDIEFILESVPKERQTVFFSATMPRPIRDLIERFARNPQAVQIQQKALTVPTVEQLYYEVDRRFKVELLTRLIDIHDIKLGIIFCNTKRMVDDLVDHLEAQGYSADRLHGDMGQGMRDRVMGKFRKSGLEFLVATDVAARGIDVDDVEVVFNYDLPYDAEDYLHRIGRTGRAGRSGRAISFVSGRELFQIRTIERFTNTRIHRAKIPTAGEVEQARDNAVIDRIRATLVSGEYSRQDHLIERLLEEGHASTDIASVLMHLLQRGDGAQGAKPARESDAPDRGGNVRPSSASTARPLPARVAALQSARPAPRPVKTVSEVAPPVSAPLPAAREAVVQSTVVVSETPVSEAVVEAPRSDEAPSEAKVEEQSTAKNEGPPAQVSKAAEPSPVSEPAVKTAPARPAKPEKKPKVIPEWVQRKTGGAYQKKDRGLPSKPRFDRPPLRTTERTMPVPTRPRADMAAPARPRVDMAAPAARPKRDFSEPRRTTALPVHPIKASRRTPSNQTRLWINVGAEMGVRSGDVVGAILGETGLPSGTVGIVDIRERHLFVDVVTEHAPVILSKLRQTKIRGQSIKANPA